MEIIKLYYFWTNSTISIMQVPIFASLRFSNLQQILLALRFSWMCSLHVQVSPQPFSSLGYVSFQQYDWKLLFEACSLLRLFLQEQNPLCTYSDNIGLLAITLLQWWLDAGCPASCLKLEQVWALTYLRCACRII